MDQPYFFYHNRRFTGRIGQAGKFDHFFGHTGAVKFQNPPLKGHLHELISLDLRDPELHLQIEGLTRLPLLYCFQFESGLLEYDLLADNRIKITTLDEKSFDAKWPYPDYPEKFPKLPFTVADSTASTLEEFAKDVWQGIPRSERNKFICIVPASNLYTVHLWEDHSNFDHISIKFFVDPLKRKVVVYNECD
jgi:hypothetical protein